MTFTLLTAAVVFAASSHAVAVLLLAFENLGRRPQIANASALALTLAGGGLLAALVTV